MRWGHLYHDRWVGNLYGFQFGPGKTHKRDIQILRSIQQPLLVLFIVHGRKAFQYSPDLLGPGDLPGQISESVPLK